MYKCRFCIFIDLAVYTVCQYNIYWMSGAGWQPSLNDIRAMQVLVHHLEVKILSNALEHNEQKHIQYVDLDWFGIYRNS